METILMRVCSSDGKPIMEQAISDVGLCDLICDALC